MTRRAIGRSTVLAVVLAGFAVVASPALAAPRPFEQRFSTNDTGDIAQVGNTLLTCPASNPDCPAAQAGTASSSALNNNGYVMQYVNADAGGGRFNSSSADLALPAGATVLKAMLYFGGDSGAGSGGAPPPDAAARDTVQFRAPGQLVYTSLTASQLDFVTTDGNDFQGVVDVTSQVAAAGSGTYWVGDLQVGTGSDREGGWALVVAYRDTSQPPRNLTIFDGFQVVNGGNPDVSIGVAGFQTPPTGAVNTRLGFVAYEGDAGSTGDSAKLNTTTLSDATNPARNFFNSAISIGGAAFTAKNPNYVNQLGFDAIQADASGVLGNGDTSAVIRLTTGGETYFPGVVTFATELIAPDVQLTKEVEDLDDGSVEPGDTLRYTVTAVNAGPDDATNVVLTDSIPANTSFVPNSLRINGVLNPPEASFDAANNRVSYNVGTGASATKGGTLPGGSGSATVSFDVTVGTPPTGTEITNTAHADFIARTLGAPLTADSNAVTSTVAAPDLTVAKTPTNFTAVAGATQDFSLTVINSGNAPTDGTVTVTDPFGAAPPGAFDEIVAIFGEGWSCTPTAPVATPADVECQRSDPLAAGYSYPPIIVSAQVVDPGPTSEIANTALVAGGGDTDTSNNSSTNIGQATERADLQLLKSAEPTTVLTGEQVTFTLGVRNGGPSTATGVVLEDTTIAANYDVDSVSASQGSCTTAVQCDLGTLAPEAEATVTIIATVTASGAGVVQADNTASVSSAVVDPDPTNDDSTVSVDVPPTADLAIAKTSDPTPLDSTAPATYTLTVTNNGPQTAEGVVVTEPLPAGFNFDSADPTQGTCSFSAPDATLICEVGPLANGAIMTIDVNGTLDGSTAGTFLTNFAAVGADTGDPDPVDNSTNSSSVVIPAADLQLTKVPSTEAPNPGDEVTFTLGVTNLGPSVAQNAQLSDPLPAGLSLVSAPGCSASGANVTCAIGTLASGASQSIQVRARVEGSAAGQQLNNVASVTSDTPDPILPNGTDNAALSVGTSQPPPPPSPPTSPPPAGPPAGLSSSAPGGGEVPRARSQRTRLVVRKTVNRRRVSAGGLLRYRLAVRVAGRASAREVRICDRLPAALSFVSARGARLRDGRACWTRRRIGRGKTVRFRLTARVNRSASGRVLNTAVARAANARASARGRVRVQVRGVQQPGGGVTG